jgi:hypothetical protein
MTTRTEATAGPAEDLQAALSAAIRAILWANEAATARLTPEQVAEVKRRITDRTHKLALFITNDGVQATAELAVIDAKAGDVFTQHLLKLYGPILAAAVPAEAVRAVNLQSLN